MPFEVLMEHVAALSPDEWELPLGVLAERWGEPAARIGDAIDALKVVRGERSYVSVRDVPQGGGASNALPPGGGGSGGVGEPWMTIGKGGIGGPTAIGGGGSAGKVTITGTAGMSYVPPEPIPMSPEAEHLARSCTGSGCRSGPHCRPGIILTSADPEPSPGVIVRDHRGREWERDWDGGAAPWTRTDGTDDPESWTKIAGNYGPVTVVEIPED